MDGVNWNLFLDDDIKLKFNGKTTEVLTELKFDSKYDCTSYLNFSKAVMTAAKKKHLVKLNVLQVGLYFQKTYLNRYWKKGQKY